MSAALPTVSVIVPCRNEAGHIESCLRDLLGQDYARVLQILVAEGDSTDGTRAVLERLTDMDDRIVLVDNPAGRIPAGLNKAIRAATGDIVLRADVHTRYAPDYISQCVDELCRTGAVNVGGPWRPRPGEGMQRAIALAFESPFSSGGARSHAADYEGAVDSVYLGCWWRRDILGLGLYDEEFLRSEDDELNLRIVRSGGLVWQSPRIQSWYEPRGSLRALFRQYRQWGYWKVKVMQKHQLPASWRHVAPALALIVGVLLAISASLSRDMALILGGGVLIYILASLLAAGHACLQKREWRWFLVLPAVFLTYHLAYGIGTIHGFLDVLLRRRPGTRMTRLTR